MITIAAKLRPLVALCLGASSTGCVTQQVCWHSGFLQPDVRKINKIKYIKKT